jgi:hypothetical protein
MFLEIVGGGGGSALAGKNVDRQKIEIVNAKWDITSNGKTPTRTQGRREKQEKNLAEDKTSNRKKRQLKIK